MKEVTVNKPDPFHLISLAEDMARQQNYHDALKFYIRAGLQLLDHEWEFLTGLKIRGLDIADINGDGEDEILVASEDCHVYVLDKNGHELWKSKMQSWAMSVSAIDLNNDGYKEVVVGSEKIYIFNHTGEVINSFSAGATDVSSLCIKKKIFEGDFIKIIAGHDDGTISAWDNEGKILWQYKCPRRIICMLAEDINQDGRVEVIAGCEDQNVYILNDEGGLKDIFKSNHWILNVGAADIYNEGYPRLVIASFEGDVHVYKYAKSATLKISQHGILGLHLAKLLPESSGYQVILGSSDKGVSILDLNGKLLWRFNTSYGHRVLMAAPDQSGENLVTIIVGSEDGTVHKYKVHLIPGLVEWIQQTYSKVTSARIHRIGLSSEEMKLLSTFVHIDPINKDATIHNANFSLDHHNVYDAIELSMELWRNNVEYLWDHKTGGRIYALSTASLEEIKRKCVFAGSEDGKAYAIDIENGSILWEFKAGGGVRGIDVSQISVNEDIKKIAVGSVDGNVYLLNTEGKPEWNFQTQNWVLFTHMQCINGDGKKEIIYGSDGHYVGATDIFGRHLWKFKTKDRVRAVTSADINNDGLFEVIAGSDDQNVYIINNLGEVIFSFPAPHWVLAIHADDINNDGITEILIGTEDGGLYVYNPQGTLLWKYETGHWIAALYTQRGAIKDEKNIVVGSADRFLYCLSNNGVLKWSFETSARVRTLTTIELSDKDDGVLFGSYDQSVYLFKVIRQDEINSTFESIIRKLESSPSFNWQELVNSTNDIHRAFAYLHNKRQDTLLAGISDPSSFVHTALCCSVLSINKDLLSEESIINLLGKQIFYEENHQHRLLIHNHIRELRKEEAINLLKELSVSIKPTIETKNLIEYLQQIKHFKAGREPWTKNIVLILSSSTNKWLQLELKSLIADQG